MDRDRMITVLGLAIGTLAVGCGTEVADPGPRPRVVTSVEIGSPSGPLVSFGEIVKLGVTVKDQDGSEISNPIVVWAGLNPDVVTVATSGDVVAQANGTARVTATVSGVADTATIVVDQAVASVLIFPQPPVLELVGDTLRAAGRAVDALGNTVDDAGVVTWSATGAVTVQELGLVEAVEFGIGTLTATSDGVSSSVSAEVIGDRFFLSSGVRIRYDLDLPDDSGGPFPAIVWVHGSGMLDRNTQRGATDPLVPEGLAVLRYDKRGVGESGGVFSNISAANSPTTLGFLAEDAANAMRFLTRLPEIDNTRIGIMGNSQAGWIVPMAATRVPEIASFMMLWSGPTVSVGLEIFYSNLADGTTTPLDDVYAQLPNFSGTEGYDALADLTSLDIPGLWQFGALDRSIPMRLDVDRLAALRAAGKQYETVVWEFGDHALRDTRVGQFYDVWSEYLRFLRDHGILASG